MIRNIVLGLVAALLLVAVAGAHVTAAVAPGGSSVNLYTHNNGNKLSFLKGAIAKNCLEDQGGCSLLAH